jgi:predicted permease
MRAFRILRDRLRAILGRNVVVDEIHEEIQFHLHERISEHERRGLSPNAARQAALRKFGSPSVVKDLGYEVRGGGVMETIGQDLRHGVRLLGRQPGFTVTAVATLALATGAAVAIFSVIDAALLRPLPYPHPEQIVQVNVNGPKNKGLSPSLSDVRTWRGANSPLGAIGIERSIYPDVVLDSGEPERVESVKVSEGYLSVYGIAPAHGRAFSEADMVPGAPGTVMLSYAFWMSRFAGDPAVVNRVIHVDREAVTIIGILPMGFGRAMPLWRALQHPAEFVNRRGSGWKVVGRLRDGEAPDSASAKLLAMVPNPPDARERDQAIGVGVRSVLDETRGDYRATVTMLAGAVGTIVLIACVNVAGLLLARGSARQNELAIRAAMGASRVRLWRQLITESLLLSSIGGVAGVALAYLTLDAIVANIPLNLPGDAPPSINAVVLAATLGVLTMNGLLFGLAPAFKLSRASSSRLMSRAGRQRAAGLSRRNGQALIAIEVALAVVTLAGAGLMVRSFLRLTNVDLGFDPSRYVTLKVEPIDAKVSPPGLYYEALLQRIRQLPSVETVGAVDAAPLADGFAAGALRRPGGEYPQQMIQMQTATADYFEAIGLATRQGRTFTPADETGPPVVIINERAAKLFFSDRPAVGGQLEIAENTIAEVVGVTANSLFGGPRDQGWPAVYQSFRPVGAPGLWGGRLTIIVRPRGSDGDLVHQLRQAAESVGPPVIIDGIRSGTDWLGERVVLPRQRTVLLGMLGGLGLVLAVVGVLGVTAYAVARRTQEIGIRVALGARPAQVVRGVFAEAIVPIVVGLAGGIGAAMFATKAIQKFLYQTSPTDAPTLAAVAVTLGVAAALAAWIPARLAARVDPVAALRGE